jgi:hypothetical protein
MKKVLKYLGIGVVLLFAAGIILGNIGNILVSKKQKDYAHSLEGMLTEVNKHLPSRVPDGFDYYIMNRVVQEGENIVWEATLDTTFFYPIRESFLPESMNGGILPIGNRSMDLDLDTLLSSNLLRQSHQLDLLYYHLFAKTGKPNPLYEEIMNRKHSQTWRIKSPFSDRQCEYTMSYNEMKETEDFCKKQPEAALNFFISEYIQRQNRLLTIASSNADINMRMTEEVGAIVFCCTFDDSYSAGGNRPVSNLRNQKEEIQAALDEDSRSLPLFYDTQNICKKAQKRFLFRFTDWNKTDSLEIKIY